MLEVTRLTKRFRGVVALDEVTFSLAAGRILGVAGPNGSGKTTLLNLLCGNCYADEGMICLDGQRLDRRSLSSRTRNFIARTYQDARVWPNHTVGEHMRLTKGGRVEHPCRMGSEAALEIVGLAGKQETLAGTLSFGQRRRLELARLLARPVLPLYVFDEPTSGGDPAFAGIIIRAITGLKSQGATVIVVEHNLGFLSEHADELLILASGRTLGWGNPKEVLARPEVILTYLGGHAQHA